MDLAAVGVERDRDLGGVGAAQGRLDDHLGGEFHSGTALFELFVMRFGEAAHAAIDVVNRTLEPSARQARRKSGIAEPSMQHRHRAGHDGATPGRETAALDQVVALAQFFQKAGNLAEVITAVGIAHDDEASASRGYPAHQGAAVAPRRNIDDSRAEPRGDIE